MGGPVYQFDSERKMRKQIKAKQMCVSTKNEKHVEQCSLKME